MKITRFGFEAVQDEIEKLLYEDRPNIIEAVRTAQAHGDLRENAEYHTAKEEQRKIESRIQYLEGIKKNAQITEISKSKTVVGFGSKIKIVNLGNQKEIIVQILSEYEASLEDDMSIISDSSPIGSAILEAKAGDVKQIHTPSGTLEYKVVEII